MEITLDIVDEGPTRTFITEASELRLAPGDFPEKFATRIGNGLDFVKSGVCPNGDYVTYQQPSTDNVLVIFND